MDPADIRKAENTLTKKKFAQTISQKEAAVNKQYRDRAKDDFVYFCRGLTIAGQEGPRLFDSVWVEFQKECLETIAPSIEAIRDGRMPAIKRVWIERTKKASKDADLALIIAWLVFFCNRPFYGQIGAADRDQAAIVRDRLSALLHLNPWLNDGIELVGNVIRSSRKRADGRDPLCRFDIKSADVAGAHGGTPDLLILNELSHLKNFEFAENMLDNANGVKRGMVIVATNAGLKGTKTWTWRKVALTSAEWQCFILSRPAPWHSKASVIDAKRMSSPSRYKRLWWGEWPSGHGDALAESDLERMFGLKRPIEHPEQDWIYLLGLDLGISHDHAGLAVVGVHQRNRRVKVVNWKRWDPKESKDGKVDLKSIRTWAKTWYFHYRALRFLYDPHQAELMVQDLQEMGVSTKEVTFSSANLSRMASCLLQVVTGHQIDCYDDAGMTLRNDFGKFNIVEKQYGQKLEAVSDQTGHADVGTAVVLTLPAAVDFMDGRTSWLDADEDIIADDSPMTEEELEDLPDEFKELVGTTKEEAYGDDDEDDFISRWEDDDDEEH